MERTLSWVPHKAPTALTQTPGRRFKDAAEEEIAALAKKMDEMMAMSAAVLERYGEDKKSGDIEELLRRPVQPPRTRITTCYP